ncbi:DUF5959 family protein [Kitasatospora terrestris]|uniref:Uncharacterized protein n=1 Tax=Kitasatospora terrestris TaxID=258051 RepID=A0ABP9DCV6_9ACTN
MGDLDVVRFGDRTKSVTVVLDNPAGGGRHRGWHDAEIVVRSGFVDASLPVHLTDADLAALARYLDARAAAEEENARPDGSSFDWPEAGRTAYLRLIADDAYVVEVRDPVQSGVTVVVPLLPRDGWAARAATRLDRLRAKIAEGS